MNNALIIFFNTDFSKNIPVLEKIYGPRFSEILYIVPDHISRLRAPYFSPRVSYEFVNKLDKSLNQIRRVSGKKNRFELTEGCYQDRILRVTGIQYFFQDYFWQARNRIIEVEADWYWFVSDDVFINHQYDQINITDVINKEADLSFIPTPHHPSVDWVNWFQESADQVIDKLKSLECYPNNLTSFNISFDTNKPGPYENRIVGGCSDIFAIHHSRLEVFFELCHQTALAKLFVELAIPNILLSTCAPVSFIDDYIWDFDLDRGDWGKVTDFLNGNKFFYHPVKLSTLSPQQIDSLMPR